MFSIEFLIEYSGNKIFFPPSVTVFHSFNSLPILISKVAEDVSRSFPFKSTCRKGHHGYGSRIGLDLEDR